MVARCTCDLARREARAEAFRDAADILTDKARVVRREFGAYDELAGVYDDAAAHFAHLAECVTPRPMAIVDCVEDDGFVTAHVTGMTWGPSEDGGLDG